MMCAHCSVHNTKVHIAESLLHLALFSCMHDVHNHCLTSDGVAMSSSYIVCYHHRDCNLQNSHCTPCKLPMHRRALILLVAAATLAAGAIVIVHLKAKPCMQEGVHNTL